MTTRDDFEKRKKELEAVYEEALSEADESLDKEYWKNYYKDEDDGES